MLPNKGPVIPLERFVNWLAENFLVLTAHNRGLTLRMPFEGILCREEVMGENTE